MKKILFLIITAACFTSCSKEEDAISSSTAEAARQVQVQAVIPSSFTQKLIMEMYTTASCATCPDAQQKYRNYAAAHPDRIYGVTVHTADGMSSPQFNILDNAFNITAYSSGSFNRLPFSGSAVLHKTTWNNTVINTCLNKTAVCGLKINSSILGTVAQATVTAAFNTALQGDYRITAYLIEDSVTGTGSGFNQANYYNNTPSSPFYMMGNPIIGYQHNYVLRQVLTQPWGEIIPPNRLQPKGTFNHTLSFNISGYDPAQLYLIAFINKVGTSGITHEVMNVQRVKLGGNKNWD